MGRISGLLAELEDARLRGDHRRYREVTDLLADEGFRRDVPDEAPEPEPEKKPRRRRS